MKNPLLDLSGLPHFDSIAPIHVEPAIEHCISEAQRAVTSAENIVDVTWDSFIIPMDETDSLARVWAQVAHLQAVSNTPELRQVYNANIPKVTEFTSALGQNIKLLEQYRRLASRPDAEDYSEARKKVLANALRDFKLGGAELEGDEKHRFSRIQQELAALSARFEQNVLDATDSYELLVTDVTELAGIPKDVVEQCRLAAEKVGKQGYRLSLAMPCYVPVLCLAENRTLRETLYKASTTRASEFGPSELDNSDLIVRIISLRTEMAKLLGFSHYASYSLATKMAESPAVVMSFLRDLAVRARPFAKKDRAELERFAADSLGIKKLEAWDIAYASEKLKQLRYEFSAQEVKRYFSEEKVLSGLFEVIRVLYGLEVREDSAPVWHSDVRFYQLVDEQGRMIGQFYLDLYAREGKRGGAWMDVCRNRRESGGVVQTPLVHLVCNFGKGAADKSATFSHEEVITLFHEMGHGLHQLLTEVGELGVAGINGVEWDAVELPSQIMENFCWEWDRVQAMTSHIETGKPLPRPLFERMLAAKNFQSGMAMLRQVELAMFDMELHNGFDPESKTVHDVINEVREEVAVSIPPPWNRFPNAFTHIFAGGYGAGYYSYKWAEVLSADAYAAFEENTAATKEVGARFRREVLSRGGSRSALENFKAFRGRSPNVEALLRHSGMTA